MNKWFKKVIATIAVILLCVSLVGAEGKYPATYNVTLTSANTEYSQVLPLETKKFTLQCRTNYDVRIAFVTDKVATPTAPYITLKKGNVYWEDEIATKISGQTIYFASSQSGVIIELICWN